MNGTELKKIFERDGVAVLEDALTPAEAEELAAALDRKIATGRICNRTSAHNERTKRAEHRVDVYQGTVIPEVPFCYGMKHITEATSAVAGEDWHFHNDANVFTTPPHGGKQGWHQDTGQAEPGIYFINRIFFPRSIVREQGPLIVVPGSHLRGDLPPGGQHDDIEGQIEITPKAGSLVFMCSRVWHRVGENRSDTPRTNVNYRVRPWAAPKDLPGGVIRVREADGVLAAG